MGVETDKITVTFYGKEECEKLANPFRKKALKKYRSLNNALKKIIKEWLEKHRDST